MYRVKAPAKINLGLYITGKRPNGYHELSSLFLPVDLQDVLEVTESKVNTDILLIDGPFSNNVPSDGRNIVLKALYRLREFVDIPPLMIKLTKNIPNGAGLGGGSSDTANFIIATIKYFNLSIKEENINKVALSLGADVSFFLEGKPALVKGIGEKIEHFVLKKDYKVLLLVPNITLSTKDVYSELTLKSYDVNSPVLLDTLAKEGLENSGSLSLLRNDLEIASKKLAPQIFRAKELLLSLNPCVAMMSGSGSAFFALFDGVQTLDTSKLGVDDAWFYYATSLLR